MDVNLTLNIHEYTPDRGVHKQLATRPEDFAHFYPTD